MWEHLADNIECLNKAYKELLILGEKKRVVLGLLDMGKLESIVENEKKYIALVEKYEENRLQILKQLSTAYVEIKREIKFEDLCRICPLGLRKRLELAHDELNNLVQDVREINAINKFLVTAALSVVEYNLNVLGNTKVNPSYGANGNEQISKNKNFDFKA